MLNLNVVKKGIVIIGIIMLVLFNILNFEFVIANSAEISLSSIPSVTEGDNISFNINFANNVKSIMVFEGDIVMKGFNASSIALTRTSNNTYAVTLYNVTGTGDNKCVIINAGVGYVEGKGMTDEAYSNVFSINQKQEIKPTPEPPIDNNDNNDNNNGGDNNNNGNSNNDNNNNNNNGNNTNNNTGNNNQINNNPVNTNPGSENEQDGQIEEVKEINKKENPNTGKI